MDVVFLPYFGSLLLSTTSNDMATINTLTQRVPTYVVTYFHCIMGLFIEHFASYFSAIARHSTIVALYHTIIP